MYYLKYKNYYTIIHYSKDDKLFYGKIEEIKDLITIKGKTLEVIEEDFKDSVDEYLDFCKDVDKIPEIPKNCPILLQKNIICNDAKSSEDIFLRKIVGYDNEEENIILKPIKEYFTYYCGIKMEDFENDWTNNFEEIQERFDKQKKELQEYIDFTKIINSKISEKTLNSYSEIMNQLRYIQSTKHNLNLYKYYIKYEKELLKGKRRKEKYMLRFLNQDELEKMKELVEEKKSLSIGHEQWLLRDIEKKETILKNYVK